MIAAARRLLTAPSPLARLGILFEPVGDLTTPEGRAHDRKRRAMLTAIMAMLAKIISVGTALITVPLTLHYLGAERYGMWMIMSSLVAMLAFADLGVGNGVLNMVAAASGRADVTEMRRAISSGLATLSVVALAIVVGFVLIYPHVPWEGLFNVNSPRARAEAGPAILVFVLCFALAIPANVVQRVQLGLQQGFMANLWLCGGSLFALFAVLLAIWLEAGLAWMVAAFLSGPLVANLLNGFVFFGFLRSDLRPSIAAASRTTGLQVMHAGLFFMILQIAAAVTYNAHNIVIAQLLGASVVPQYSVPDRLFALITMTATMALGPLWPAYRESITRGDVEWTRRTLRRSIRVAILYAGALSIPLVLFGPWIIQLWVGGAVQPPMMLIVGLGLWKVIEAGGLAFSMFLNGAHVIRLQAAAAAATALVSIVLEIMFVRSFGVAGTVWATMIAFVLFSIVPYALLAPRIMRSLKSAAITGPPPS
jgi:O-antigen/teichoic acid export membrane protein